MTHSEGSQFQHAVLFSIATASHLAMAVAALLSAPSQSMPLRRVVCLVGARTIRESGHREVELIHAEDVIDNVVLSDLVDRYTPAEVCFALKPHVMSVLFSSEPLVIHYIDSDIRFFAGLHILEKAFGDGDILLTPHYLDPYPDDGHRPRMLTLLRGGIFNAGYIAVRNTEIARMFLQWWGERVRRAGENNPNKGTCGDQRWLDLVPVLFPSATICRHPGANVAYWNLHERQIAETGEVITCNGQPLLFFHFSGFDTAKPLAISTYQNRTNAKLNPVLSRLLLEYESEDLSGPAISTSYQYWHWWHGHGRLASLARRWLRRNKI